MATSNRLANLVRVLGLLALVLGVVAVLEARSIRALRGELQQLRTERNEAKVAAMTSWTRQAGDEFVQAAGWLDRFYREPTEGFGKADGLCPKGTPDYSPVAAWVLGPYVAERAAGRTPPAALAAMEAAIRRTDAYKAVHPDGK